MKRIDAYRDGKLILSNQALSNPTVAARLRAMMLAAGNEVVVREHAAPAPPPPSPAPSGFGDAGLFAGRGIMLGSNSDVWDQAVEIHRTGYCDVVAIVPNTPLTYFPSSLKVVTWIPPHLEPWNGDIHQAENAEEWKNVHAHFNAPGVCLNSWEYGRIDGKVALVEAYYNEGWPLNFNEFHNYMSQGARGVIPLIGGYSAPGRTDAAAGLIYESLAAWGPGFPGYWAYAGESYLTPESVKALKAWKP